MNEWDTCAEQVCIIGFYGYLNLFYHSDIRNSMIGLKTITKDHFILLACLLPRILVSGVRSAPSAWRKPPIPRSLYKILNQ